MGKARVSLKIKTIKGGKPTRSNKRVTLVDDKMQKVKKLIQPGINYCKIKYKNEIYSIGDCLLIRDEAEDSFLIGKLVKIIQYNGYKKYPYWPTIQVQW
jgi:hypothetical protein